MVRGYIYTHYAEMSRENRKLIHKYAENTFDIHNVCNRYGTVLYFKLEKYANYAENELKFYSDFA